MLSLLHGHLYRVQVAIYAASPYVGITDTQTMTHTRFGLDMIMDWRSKLRVGSISQKKFTRKVLIWM